MLATEPLWQRMIILAPAFVIGIGSDRRGADPARPRVRARACRESGHQRLIYAGLAVLAVFIVVLTYLGVELPREGG